MTRFLLTFVLSSIVLLFGVVYGVMLNQQDGTLHPIGGKQGEVKPALDSIEAIETFLPDNPPSIPEKTSSTTGKEIDKVVTNVITNLVSVFE